MWAPMEGLKALKIDGMKVPPQQRTAKQFKQAYRDALDAPW